MSKKPAKAEVNQDRSEPLCGECAQGYSGVFGNVRNIVAGKFHETTSDRDIS